MTQGKDKTHFVFVYGTLKQRKDAHGIRIIGPAVTNSVYLLFDGGYPLAVVDDAQSNMQGKIRGQLLEVSEEQLRHMDHYEGHPSFYERSETSVSCDGLDHEAFIYLGSGAKTSIPQRHVIVPDEKGELSWEYR